MDQAKVDETLQKGIRAARRGYKEPARQLLAQVLRADPDNEEAWLWLSRVADTPEQRADCLRHVLSINPDNRWAAEQLEALQAEAPTPAASAAPAAAPVTPVTPPAAPPEIKLEPIKCPNCGGSMDLRGGSESKTLVCSYCRSLIDLTGEQAAIIGQTDKRAKPAAPIELGMEGTFDGERYQVIGWVRYEGWDDEDRWRWDEWLLVSSKGEFRWLSYDPEEGFLLQKKIPPPQAFDPRTATSIPVPGGTARVMERSPGRIIALAGELTWRATVGEQFNYLEARRGPMRYSVEYTREEIELLEGRSLPDVEVWQAFGRQDLVEKALKDVQRKKQYRTLAIVCAVFMILGCLGSLFAALTGRKLLTQEMQMTKGSTSQTMGPFEITQPGRVHRVSLRSDRLPTNNWAVVDVSLGDSKENEFYLFSAEFWDEEGRDSEGYWHESDLKEDHLFRPDDGGQYTLEVAMEEATVESLTLEVTVKSGIWLSRYFVIFAVLCGGLCFLFFALSAGR